jgi:NADPH2 dehydrogenase
VGLWLKLEERYFLSPLSTNKLNLCNRLVMPPMATAKAKADGKITSEQISYYGEKSKGGYISLVIIEHSFITLQGKASEKQLSIADDSGVADLIGVGRAILKNSDWPKEAIEYFA